MIITPGYFSAVFFFRLLMNGERKLFTYHEYFIQANCCNQIDAHWRIEAYGGLNGNSLYLPCTVHTHKKSLFHRFSKCCVLPQNIAEPTKKMHGYFQVSLHKAANASENNNCMLFPFEMWLQSIPKIATSNPPIELSRNRMDGFRLTSIITKAKQCSSIELNNKYRAHAIDKQNTTKKITMH